MANKATINQRKEEDKKQPSSLSCELSTETYRELCQTETDIPLFSRDWWLDIVCGKANWKVLLIKQKGQVLAALPLYIPHSRIVSMPPYTQTMGPWFAQEAQDMKYSTRLGYRQTLCKCFIEALQEYSFFYQHFHFDITDWLPFYWAGFNQTTRYTYRLTDLSNETELLANMSANTRRNLTKARDKYHITVVRGIPEEDFLTINRQTFKRQGLSVPQDPEILRQLIRTCRQRNQGDIWGGYDKNGQLHAAVFIVWQESSAWYLAGGGNPSLRSSGAHSLVMWEAIREVAPYTRQFDFEGSMLPGVERFFREFGAIQTPYHAITKGKISLLHRALIKLKKLI